MLGSTTAVKSEPTVITQDTQVIEVDEEEEEDDDEDDDEGGFCI